MSRFDSIDRELDAQTKAIVSAHELGDDLDDRVDAIEGTLRKDQAETIREYGLPAELVSAEQNALRRMSPFRNRWPEVLAFDERAAALEMRQGAVAAELRELHERARAAPAADAEALADWELNERKGSRPEPSLPSIEDDIKRLQDEWEGLVRAVTRVLAEKAEYVERHRHRLVKEADAHSRGALADYVQAIDELERRREELAASRRASVWAALFPAEQANQQPPDSLAGARKRALAPLGVTAAVAPNHMFTALREDARYLAEAATPEQKLLIAGRDPKQPPNTEWSNTPEARAERDRKTAAWLRSR